jgi:[ribosomal protein S18]-alanine N-acetyltransferase
MSVTDRVVGVRLDTRLPEPGDVPDLVVAERACFPDPWPAHFFVAETTAAARFNRLLVGQDGRMVGYLFSAWQYLDLHVLKVATLPAYRRRGVARLLMQLAEDHARTRDGESVTLEVRPSNRAAIALYLGIGYLEVGQRPRYYADGEDALVMTRGLRRRIMGR